MDVNLYHIINCIFHRQVCTNEASLPCQALDSSLSRERRLALRRAPLWAWRSLPMRIAKLLMKRAAPACVLSPTPRFTSWLNTGTRASRLWASTCRAHTSRVSPMMDPLAADTRRFSSRPASTPMRSACCST